jgi:hypothetical protein
LKVRSTQIALASLPYLAALFGAVWVFRSVFSGDLPGDVGDARWTVAIHDHWYHVWLGDVAVRDLNSFFPVAGTLGTSDAFVAQGQFYTIARLFGWGLIDAWVIAQFVTFLIGTVGMAALSRRLFNASWARVAFVLLSCVSYPVYLQLGHVQLFAIFWPAWIVLAILDLSAGRHLTTSALVLAALPPLIALSSWYVFVLATGLGCLFVVLRAMSASSDDLRRFKGSIEAAWDRRSSWRAIIVPALVAVAGWAAVAWIFLAGRGILAPPTWDDVVPYSPRWSDLLNASGGGGGVWQPLYESWFRSDPPVSSERAAGFGILLLTSMLVTLVLTARAVARRSHVGRPGDASSARTLFAVSLSVLIAPLILIMDERGLSLFKALWISIPGLESIRAPFRVQGLVYASAFYAIVRSLEIRIKTIRCRTGPLTEYGKRVRRPVFLATMVGALLFGLFVEMHRPPYANWVAEQLVPFELSSYLDEVEATCDAVVVVDDPPSKPIWMTPIDAVMVSTLTGVPTPQGYGRGAPIGHPGFGANLKQLDDWMRSLGFDGTTCALSSLGVRPVNG